MKSRCTRSTGLSEGPEARSANVRAHRRVRSLPRSEVGVSSLDRATSVRDLSETGARLDAGGSAEPRSWASRGPKLGCPGWTGRLRSERAVGGERCLRSAKLRRPGEPTWLRSGPPRNRSRGFIFDATGAGSRRHEGMRSEHALAWHITMRLAADRVIAATPSALRRAARSLIERARGRDLLAFCMADNHVHVVLGCSREEAGRFARTAEQSMQLGLGLGVPFERARLRPILGTSHLAHAVRYVLRQGLHHGAEHDPGFDGCSIVDMFGLRVLDPELPHRVQRYLPRLTRRAAAPWFPRLRSIDPEMDALAIAAAAAVAAADLRSNTPTVVAARRAAIEIVDLEDAAALLGLTPRAARRLRARPPNPLLVRAVRGQLALQTWAAERRASGLPSAEGELDGAFAFGSRIRSGDVQTGTGDFGPRPSQEVGLWAP
jgi:hypothetical protein